MESTGRPMSRLCSAHFSNNRACYCVVTLLTWVPLASILKLSLISLSSKEMLVVSVFLRFSYFFWSQFTLCSGWLTNHSKALTRFWSFCRRFLSARLNLSEKFSTACVHVPLRWNIKYGVLFSENSWDTQ